MNRTANSAVSIHLQQELQPTLFKDTQNDTLKKRRTKIPPFFGNQFQSKDSQEMVDIVYCNGFDEASFTETMRTSYIVMVLLPRCIKPSQPCPMPTWTK